MNQEKDKMKKNRQAAGPGKEQTEPQAETQAGKPEHPAPEPKQEQASAEGPGKELEETKRKLGEAEEALAKQKDTLLRTAAEYDNYRKRTARDKESLYSDATADAVKEFLGVADNLERALAQKDCSVEDLRKGVEMTQKQMLAALEKLGVAEMGAEGDPFDPALHSAVAHIEDKSLGENVVAKVFQKGYRIGDKVIRHAMVQAAN